MIHALDDDKKHDPRKGDDAASDVLDDLGIKKKEPRIRCPKCRWRPRKEDRWFCNKPKCGCVWNTFDTHGVCPKCSHVWMHTACLACHQWSLHEDWYGADDD